MAEYDRTTGMRTRRLREDLEILVRRRGSRWCQQRGKEGGWWMMVHARNDSRQYTSAHKVKCSAKAIKNLITLTVSTLSITPDFAIKTLEPGYQPPNEQVQGVILSREPALGDRGGRDFGQNAYATLC